MKFIPRLGILSLSALALAGCSSIEQHTANWSSKRNLAYTKAQSQHGLQMVAGLTASRTVDEYSIPPTHSSGPVPVSIKPPRGNITVQAPVDYPTNSAS